MRVEFDQVTKSFGAGRRRTVAVNDVSCRAAGGEVFGLLGPNGAGKTTMIRMMLDIYRPDAGQILIDGDPGGARRLEFKRRVGYLPEERGLYKKRKVLEVLIYFAALKGIKRSDAKRRALDTLERFELADCARKRIEDLSKGMSQKVQIASCVLHDPDMVILDEPFSGLDPVNVRLVRQLILELKGRGKLVFLSTHMMAEVEALCDRIFMIHQGRRVLYGGLEEIKRSYSDHEILLDGEVDAGSLQSVEGVRRTAAGMLVRLRAGLGLHDLLAELAAQRQPVRRVIEASLPIEDIFVSLVKGDTPTHDPDGRAT
jgi:ABC-2 type transport system ATP-binding protein